MAGLKRVGSSLSLASPHKVVTPLDWPCVIAIPVSYTHLTLPTKRIV